ncbi:asparagine synthase (glutamine-hydrolyzing) [Salimicrobium halophilum]|uniref:asparagine synthase (glutamine-hydrolyzing) n=1 Tax=Salimicrobium halophilum TaxID=86666 RepID=A0A1G8TRT2_9BACI|nr:asparagine synthase (glutamine-hydrolyzing) [Salimicrobium halophilum]SDJ44114.1 asparagine synthase (glutamine-hydrolysing) [Salimicrobium halophilum]
MCGIAGWIGEEREDHRRDVVDRMTAKIAHRGPDDHQLWIGEAAGFGHRRLAVIDPSGGKQPMVRSFQGETYVLCYNGELYNTDEVRNVLQQKGWTFHTHSDTEVVLVSYMEWKEKAPEYLNGIFAFSIWETKRKRLFLARDRMGVKPLFFSELAKGFIFASELKALLVHPDMEAILDHQSLSEFFALGPSRTPGSGVFKGVYELKPGHAGFLENGSFRIFTYWTLKGKEHTDSFEETKERVRELFLEATRRQLVSDVEIGTFLSGGLDSSAITSVAAGMRKDLPTFSIDYEDQASHFRKNDFQPDLDAPFIEKVSKAGGTSHTVCTASISDLVGSLEQAVELRDLPGMADVDSSLLWFSGQMKKHVTVALSGECADEIFAGYPWFYRGNEGGFPWIRSERDRQHLIRKEWKMRLPLEEYAKKKYEEITTEAPLSGEETVMEKRHKQLIYANMNYFMQVLLERKDRMSMGASLEVRVPFSDHRLVEYAYNIPRDYTFREGREKSLLREAFQGIVPESVRHRKKNPYPKTFHPDYTKAVCDWMGDIVSDGNQPLFDLFSRKHIKKLYESEGKQMKEPWFGQLMTGPQLIAYLCQVNHWLKTVQPRITVDG